MHCRNFGSWVWIYITKKRIYALAMNISWILAGISSKLIYTRQRDKITFAFCSYKHFIPDELMTNWHRIWSCRSKKEFEVSFICLPFLFDSFDISIYRQNVDPRIEFHDCISAVINQKCIQLMHIRELNSISNWMFHCSTNEICQRIVKVIYLRKFTKMSVYLKKIY